MTLGSLVVLVRRELSRARGALVTGGFGIAVGTAALVFFLALGLGVRAVLLGEVFPLDQLELEPPKAEDPGLFALLAGGGAAPGLDPSVASELAAMPEVARVLPKLRLATPASARGGKELLGRDVGASELIGDGVDPALVRDELGATAAAFEDRIEPGGAACADDLGCGPELYCERPSGAAEGRCSPPVPALVSRYLVELFDKSIAPAHGLPSVGRSLVARAEGVVFTVRLGESLLGRAKRGEPRTVKVRVVGVSRRAVDLGLTFPRSVVARWNREYVGDAAAERPSSVVVEVRSNDGAAAVLARAKALGLEPRDTRARDVSVLVTGIIALLGLVAAVVLSVSASTIAYTFRVLVAERQAEIALYRALGATGADMRRWMLALAALVGLAGSLIGLMVARVAAFAADLAAARGLPDFPFKPASFFLFSPEVVLTGLFFGASFALLGAIGPARRASRVDPSLALSGS